MSGFTHGSLGGSNAGGTDAWLARYDSAGNQLWIRQLGSNTDDLALDAAPDGGGGVYVSGFTDGSLGGPNAGDDDAWLTRYDSAGNQIWVRQLGTSKDEWGMATAPDGAGGVYVSGYTDGSLGGPNAGGWDAWLARYNSAGNQVWIRQFGSNSFEFPAGAAPDGAGGVYLSGVTTGSLGGPQAGLGDAWLARYDGMGNQLWIRQLGTSQEDVGSATTPDAGGGVYLSGSTQGNLGGQSAGLNDAWIARYDSAGTQQWIGQFGSNHHDREDDAAPDGAGGVYLSGYTQGSLGGPSAGGPDIWLARYGPCGIKTYCTASTTSIPGCQAAIGTHGSASLANPDGFSITSGSVPGGGNVGICIFGKNGRASIPFGTLGGQVCVQPPFFRSGPKASGGTPGTCNGTFKYTLQDLIDASPIIVEGLSINAEVWGRDAPNPDGFLLSNGLQFTICP